MGEEVPLSLWLSDVDGLANGDGAGGALICNNKNIIIKIEIINYYIYIYI